MAAIVIKKKPKSSNKTETLPEIHPLQSVAIAPSSVVKSHPAPFIDKISIVVIPDEKRAHDIYVTFFQHLEDTTVFKDAPKGKLKGFNTAKRIALPSLVDTKKYPLVQLGYDKSKQRVDRLRLEFVPEDLKSAGMEELDLALGELVEDGWDYIRKNGHVTRIDITVDFPDLEMDSFLFMPQQMLTIMSWKVSGKLQTLTFGKKQGNQTLIYDRGEKRKAKGQSAQGKSGVRIERRLAKPGNLPLSKLPGLGNPFSGLVFADHLPVSPPPEIGSSQDALKQWTMFRDSVQVRHLANALALLSEERRTVYRKYIKSQVLPWWDPDAIWSQWHTMLNSMKFT